MKYVRRFKQHNSNSTSSMVSQFASLGSARHPLYYGSYR